jgi:NAD(P)-dependent dehydrogenase (short-subunit alcohol dehydrogenase family)
MSKLVVITGVSRGLGRSMAMGLADAGCTVCGCGRTSDAMEELASALPATHRFDVVDVTSSSQVAEWQQAVQESHGIPDLIVNNAAVINANAALWEVSAEEFDHVMAVNVSGTANVLRAFVPAMLQKKTGVVVNFSSGWGRSVSAHVAPYCASKWAIEGLNAALAEELPEGMAAIALNPGIINTSMLQSCFGSGAQSFLTADEWAQAAVPFILSLNASHNGQALTVPGQ